MKHEQHYPILVPPLKGVDLAKHISELLRLVDLRPGSGNI